MYNKPVYMYQTDLKKSFENVRIKNATQFFDGRILLDLIKRVANINKNEETGWITDAVYSEV